MPLLTVHDVAGELKVHPRTVKRWITEGQLAAFKLGDRAGWRIDAGALQAFLDERRQEPPDSKLAA